MTPSRTSWSTLVVLVACGGTPRSTPVPRDPIDRKDTIEYTLVPADDSRAGRRAAVLRELVVVDRELDAIDEELAAGAIPGPATRDEAIAATTARLAALQRTAPDALFAETPTLLVRGANAYYAARDRDAELANENGYGERHPERILQRRAIEALRGAFDRQRDVELAVTAAWRDELGKLPKQATAVKIRQANRRALQATLARFASDGIVPSDVPAELRVAAARVAEAKQRIDAAAHTLGPKHPDMIAMHADLAAARDALRDAIALTDAAITREIVALDAPRARPLVDPARLARRAELAAKARDLRREWDALRRD
jgi:hypothetical protein